MLTFLQIGCKVKKYPSSYFIYKGDQEINYPNSKIELLFLDDSTAFFINYLSKEHVFKQRFNYNISENSFIVVKKTDTLNKNIISLNINDTIITYKNKMYYFYNGDKNFFIYFKK